MKRKQTVDIASSILFMIIACFILLCPLIELTDIHSLFLILMGSYALINLGKFLLTKESHDYEGLLSSFASLLIGGIALFYKSDAPSKIALLLFSWIILESFIKLKKADYYHDRKSKIWIVEICSLFIFILIGILTSINLNYQNDIKILLLGYFFFIHSILELIDPMIIYLTKESKKNETHK